MAKQFVGDFPINPLQLATKFLGSERFDPRDWRVSSNLQWTVKALLRQIEETPLPMLVHSVFAKDLSLRTRRTLNDLANLLFIHENL
jgi:hypothetical protein